MSDKPNGFFSRWQQRREQVAEEAENEQLQQAEEERQQVVQEAQPAQSEASSDADTQSVETAEDKVLTAEDLPDPDKIEEGGSFAAFMAKNVDPSAKKAALRALWKQPHYNEVCGMAEYALDYSNQPLLSAADSADLVKKVFRRVIEKEEKEREEQERAERLAAQQADLPQSPADETQPQPAAQIEDSLHDSQELVSQNVPDEPSTVEVTVGKGQFS